MIEDAINNPEQQYETDCGKVHYKNGRLHWVDSELIFAINYDTLKLKWRKVSKPVEFMMAVKAHNIGKTIVCKTQFDEFSYSKNNSNYSMLVDEEGATITSSEILEGEWFIKD